MGVITLLTLIAFGAAYGAHRKAKKDRQQRERRLQQGSIPSADTPFPGRGMPSSADREAWSEEEEELEEDFFEEEAASLEEIPQEEAKPLEKIIKPAEPIQTDRKEEPNKNPDTPFSLREAVVAQTILERRYC